MYLSLFLLIVIGFSFARILNLLRLPRIIGMLLGGIVLGPFGLNLLDQGLLDLSPDLRKIALLVILLKAGLSLDVKDLKQVGRPAILLSFLPATFEILGYYFLAPKLLGISPTEALLMGAVLGAVSPAVVVPRMVSLMDLGYGTKKGIPQMILSGASCDDVYVIVLFTSFLGMVQGGSLSLRSFLSIPISIGLGALAGVLFGWGLFVYFEWRYRRGELLRNSSKIFLLLAFSFFLVALETMLENKIPFSSFIGVLVMAAVLKGKMEESVSQRLSEKMGKLWIGAEVVLFVLVGAAVDIRYTLAGGWAVVFMVLLPLLIRSWGVFLATVGTHLNGKERLFVVASYLPKATVQAAIGGVALSMGLSCGKIILSVAVVAILITAPLGAFLMDALYKKCLEGPIR
ncbi:cation:proton antiporter [Peptoniphilus sp. KCTC 25270]|uniref:cation:proton antiporter n=1 Tax=Peptoniphilus sp. KCTC 25270 TaxID=2897414 RepID=UPI001E4612F1|nr:cation:proton antiporter [Peptoniphilus sp. KCTC 25270]MCD1147413.1 cation:proton antiporter [Peptoniphilus sp. KCTC 25270]